jgi:hypothetical protein
MWPSTHGLSASNSPYPRHLVLTPCAAPFALFQTFARRYACLHLPTSKAFIHLQQQLLLLLRPPLPLSASASASGGGASRRDIEGIDYFEFSTVYTVSRCADVEYEIGAILDERFRGNGECAF